MNVWRTLNLQVETYTQSIYEWPDKPSKVLTNSSLWMHWQVDSYQTSDKQNHEFDIQVQVME